jgi:hypothetical protein
VQPGDRLYCLLGVRRQDRRIVDRVIHHVSNRASHRDWCTGVLKTADCFGRPNALGALPLLIHTTKIATTTSPTANQIQGSQVWRRCEPASPLPEECIVLPID